MITSIRVQNYQSIADSTVELGTLTVLVGQSDLGKSAFFRAVKAAAESQPGTAFITYGAHRTIVTLEVDDHVLKWEKGESINRYYLDDNLYDRVGRSVPPDVSEFLALGPVEFDTNLVLSLNFAEQDDPPFLVPMPGGMSPTHVAKVLGDLTNLNILFKAVGEADGRRKRAESQSKLRDDDIYKLKQSLKLYDDVEARALKAEQLSCQIGKAKELDSHLTWLESLRTQLERFRQEHVAVAEMNKSVGAIPDVESLNGFVKRIQELQGYRTQLAFHTERMQEAYQESRDLTSDYHYAEEELRVLMDSIKTCPICERPMSEEHAHANAN